MSREVRSADDPLARPNRPRRSAVLQNRVIEAAIEADVLSGRYRPGQRIEEQEIAQTFGVSRTPVRDAIRRLSALGLLVVKPQSGTFVAKFELSELLNHFEYMSLLEGLCCRLAAKRMTDEELDALMECARRCVQVADAKDAGAYHIVNAEYHQIIYAGTRNPVLVENASIARKRVGVYRRMTLDLPNRVKRSAAEHMKIAETLRSRDERAAELAILEHNDIKRDEFTHFVQMVVAM